MDKLQLETNYLYYLSGVNISNRVDISKAKSELKNNQTVIS